MGGILALEAARRLARSGHVVAMLAMFDTYGPSMAGNGMGTRFNPQRWLQVYTDMDSDERLNFWRRVRTRLVVMPLRRLRARLSGDRSAWLQDERLQRVERANHRALAGYVAQPYAGDLHLFRTSGGQRDNEPSMGWRRWIEGQVEIVELPGTHRDFIDQPELARRLRLLIDRVTGRQNV
jgi:thioesterase domain-containing protein